MSAPAPAEHPALPRKPTHPTLVVEEDTEMHAEEKIAQNEPGSPSPARLGRSPSLKRRGNLSPLRLQGLTTEEKVVLKDRPTSRSPERVDGSAAANVYPLATQLLDRGASRGFAVVQEQDAWTSA